MQQQLKSWRGSHVQWMSITFVGSTSEVMRRAEREMTVTKVGGDQILLVLRFSKVTGDAFPWVP